MNVRELGEAARKLKAKAVLEGDGEQDSLNTAWNELEVIYVHARRVLGGGFSLVGAKKDWASIKQYSDVVKRECERLDDDKRSWSEVDARTDLLSYPRTHHQ